ncbi:MAG: fatty acid--CoA ligase [PS1 clade bacterium]|uniref:3-methylmercaptopropionyl-CoA ligase n=1 Tax=PS1 clade bacterium TaxID=2175152 RepID=A0A937HJA5_9PROT|nr:fatty acid--CoA ligase [PS1 clade bacterium]
MSDFILIDAIEAQAAKQGDKTALVFKGRETSYNELSHTSNQVAQALLAEGIEPHARIGFMGANSDLYFQLLFGVQKTRSVLVGVNSRLAGPEVAYVLNDAKAEMVFVGKDFVPLIETILADCPTVKRVIAMDGGHAEWAAFEDWRDTAAPTHPQLDYQSDDDFIQLYTSGTTGHPKGVQLTNANMQSALAQAEEWAGWNDNEHVLLCMPLFHIAGVNVGLIGLYEGAKVTVLPEVDPAEILRLVEQEKVSILFMVPAVILFVMQMPNIAEADVSSVRQVIYGASPIAEELLVQAATKFKCDFVQVYGLTETTGCGTNLSPADHDPARNKLRSCGKANKGVEIRIVDEDGKDVPQGEVGEIVMRAASNMKGYWAKPDATAEAVRDGWFYSGDAGFLDAEGYVFIHDRVKDMIVSGGENVYPAEVENALFAHPQIADVAVIGVPDEKWGEAVKACVVPEPGAELSPDEIIAFARERIAGYKLPKSVDFVEALPRNPSGKILRRELRDPYWEGHGRRVG